jgi:hypothetical protein
MGLDGAIDGLVRFWVADAPPLHGWARIFVYGSLLLLLLPDPRRRPWYRGSYTPLVAPEMRAWTTPAFFQPERFARLVPWWLYHHAVLRWVRAITVVAWLACIVGLGGAVSAWTCAGGLVLLWAVTSGCLGTNHRWYFPVYTIVACAFAGPAFGHELSLDAWLVERFPGYWLAPQGPLEAPLAWSGFARKLVIVTGVALLFLGGVSKLRNSGLRWMDGRTLAFYVGGSSGAWPWLKRRIQASAVLAIALSVGTMVLELGSVAAVFVPEARLPTGIAAIGLHLGIWLTMAPKYWPSMPCYVLWVSWPWEAPASMPTEPSGSLVAASLLATAFWGWVLVTVVVQRREGWPLSCVPMYSFYRDLRVHSHAHLQDLEQAEHAAREVLRAGCVNVPCWSARWVRVRLTAPGRVGLTAPGRTQQLHQHVTSTQHLRGCHRRQWARMRWNAAAAVVRGEDLPGARRFLEDVRALARDRAWIDELPAWTREPGTTLELVLSLREGPRVLASVPWDPEARAHASGSAASGSAGAPSLGTS